MDSSSFDCGSTMFYPLRFFFGRTYLSAEIKSDSGYFMCGT